MHVNFHFQSFQTEDYSDINMRRQCSNEMHNAHTARYNGNQTSQTLPPPQKRGEIAGDTH